MMMMVSWAEQGTWQRLRAHLHLALLFSIRAELAHPPCRLPTCNAAAEPPFPFLIQLRIAWIATELDGPAKQLAIHLCHIPRLISQLLWASLIVGGQRRAHLCRKGRRGERRGMQLVKVSKLESRESLEREAAEDTCCSLWTSSSHPTLLISRS